MKKILVLVATAIILASCSNASDSVMDLALLQQVQRTSKKDVINETVPVDLGEDLTGYVKCSARPSDYYDDVRDYIYIAADKHQYYQSPYYYLKPVLKIKSDDRGVVFLNGSMERTEWVYKCEVYAKEGVDPNAGLYIYGAPFYYQDPDDIGYYDLYCFVKCKDVTWARKPKKELLDHLIW